MKSRRRCSSAWSCSNASKQFLHWKLCQLVFKTARSWIWVKTVEVLRWYGMWSTILKIPINDWLIFFCISFLGLSFSQPSKCFGFCFFFDVLTDVCFSEPQAFQSDAELHGHKENLVFMLAEIRSHIWEQNKMGEQSLSRHSDTTDHLLQSHAADFSVTVLVLSHQFS